MLSTDAIAAAEHLLGIRFMAAERAFMVDDLDGQIDLVDRRLDVAGRRPPLA